MNFGLSYRVFDFSVLCTLKLCENKELKLQADFFNVLNHANFTDPMLPNFGIDFLANGTSPSGSSRNVQFSARFSF